MGRKADAVRGAAIRMTSVSRMATTSANAGLRLPDFRGMNLGVMTFRCIAARFALLDALLEMGGNSVQFSKRSVIVTYRLIVL